MRAGVLVLGLKLHVNVNNEGRMTPPTLVGSDPDLSATLHIHPCTFAPAHPRDQTGLVLRVIEVIDTDA